VSMSMAHLLPDTNDRSVRARKHDSYKAKGKLREPSVCRESIAICHKGRWTWDPGNGKTILTSPRKQILFSQGEAADAVFYIQAGKVKLTVVSPQGKEAVVAMLERGAFLGEGCLTGQLVYMATATAIEDSTLIRIEKQAMIRALHADRAFSALFLTHLLARNLRIQEDLVDQLLSSSEKRLARILLLMAHFGKEGQSEALIPKVSQEVLADMIGTTRSRVSFFMNKFRKLGFLEYNGGVHVHSSILNIVLHD
jgi:CRP/FNR family cyclic AMP-dependent transcriptional regulator